MLVTGDDLSASLVDVCGVPLMRRFDHYVYYIVNLYFYLFLLLCYVVSTISRDIHLCHRSNILKRDRM